MGRSEVWRSVASDGAREAARRARMRWRTGHLLAWRFAAAAVPRAGQVPSLGVGGRGAQAMAFYSGRISLAGRTVHADGRCPFDIADDACADEAWRAALHGFTWLDDMAAAETPVARNHAAVMVDDWLERHARSRRGIAWRADVASDRLIAWLRHGPMLTRPEGGRGPGPDEAAWRATLARHIRHLTMVGPVAETGAARLHAAVAAATGAVACGLPSRLSAQALGRLGEALTRHLPLGGVPADRRLDRALPLLEALTTLRESCALAGVRAPRELSPAIDRLARALADLRPSGRPVRFHGSAGHADGDGAQRLRAVLAAASESRTGARAHAGIALHDGFVALGHGRTRLVMDATQGTGLEARRNGHAAPLAFELHEDDGPVIVNCGVPAIDDGRYRPYTYATAAHSTASLDDGDAATLLTGWPVRWLGQRLVGRQPSTRLETFTQDGWDGVRASHDGWAQRHGIVHERTLSLSQDGERVVGVDRFVAAPGQRACDVPVCLRFHLPFEAAAAPVNRRGRVLLTRPRAGAWTFACTDARAQVEESVVFDAPDGPRRSLQLVIRATTDPGRDGRGFVCHWSLERQPSVPETRRRSEASEPTGDLLAMLD